MKFDHHTFTKKGSGVARRSRPADRGHVDDLEDCAPLGVRARHTF
jgi:hypothetical protein